MLPPDVATWKNAQMQNSRAKAATTFPKNKAKLEPQTELCGFIYICNTHTHTEADIGFVARQVIRRRVPATLQARRTI